MDFDIKTELLFVLKAMAGYTIFFFIVMYILNKTPHITYFLQGMLVMMLVSYIVRVVFKIMKNID